MAETQNIPGEIHITTISLYTNKGVINMVEHVDAITITESIILPGAVAELTIWDTKNLSSLLPILGTERLVIKFCTPGRKECTFDLVVVQMKDAIISSNMRTKAYTLVAISPEMVVDKSIKVCKSYKTNISNIVKDIASSYLTTKKKLDIQQTKGIQNIIVPDLQPLTAIEWMKTRSVSLTDKTSVFCFFENRDGYHFRSIEDLFSKGTVGDRVFTDDTTVHTDIRRSEFRNIIAYEQEGQFNIVDRLNVGGVNKEVQKFDFKTLEYKKTSYKFDTGNFKNADGTSKFDHPDLAQKYGSKAGKSIWVPHDSGNPDTFLSDSDAFKTQGSSILRQGCLSMEVFGDSEMTAGTLLEAKIVENRTSTQAPQEHAQLSGKYLIGVLQHVILPEGNNPRYTCMIEGIKGGYKDISA